MIAHDSILVIDPEESIRDLLAEYLTRRGYLVHTASGKAEALPILLEHSVSVVLIDPGYGRSASKMIKLLSSQHGRVRSILMTGKPTLCTVIHRTEAARILEFRAQVLEDELRRHGLPLPDYGTSGVSGAKMEEAEAKPSQRHYL